MVTKFETPIPDHPDAALARAEGLLGRYGFVRDAERAGVYVRASRWGTGAGMYPRQVRTRIALAFGNGAAHAALVTDPLRGPVSALDRHVWQGEMDDLRAAIENVPGPGRDRNRENTAAGTLAAITVVLTIAIMAAGFAIRGPVGIGVALFAVVPFAIYVAVPFRMPRYNLADATSTDLSNYPR